MGKPSRVRIQNRQRRLKVDTSALRRVIMGVLEGEDTDPRAELGVVLFRDKPVARLNERYRGREGPTDVLSFPTERSAWPPDEAPFLGEVIVSIDRAYAQAEERGLAPGIELKRLVVHGVLHLLGYRDETRAGRARMRRREDRYLTAASHQRR